MNLLRVYAPVVFTLLAFSPPSVSCANDLVTNPGPGIIATSAANDSFGFDFAVGASPLLVTALGFWDENTNGLTNSHNVGLWHSSGTLLGSVAVPAGSAASLSGEFRFVTLSIPVVLASGQQYALAAEYGSSDLDRYVSNFGGNQATFDSAVTPGASRFTHPGFGFPSLVGGAGSVVGPNAQFTTIPEPTTLILLFSAGAFLVARPALRRR